MERREFSTMDVVSVYTGKLLWGGAGPLYDIIDFMEGYPHMTHELADAGDRVNVSLDEQFPWLAGLMEVADTITPESDKAYVADWVDSITTEHGLTLMVEGRGSVGPEVEVMEVDVVSTGE